MVRLTDLEASDREHLLAKPSPPLPGTPWVRPPALSECRFALVTTAGLTVRGDRNFATRTSEYRVIPADARGEDLLMSHASVNFDRTGYQEDPNVVLPVDRFRELAEAGRIGAIGRNHYSFMGAYLEPSDYEASAREVAGHLRSDGVDAVFLTPV